MLYIWSTFALILIGAGIYFRKIPALHLRLMSAAFITDVLLVVYIELNRSAIRTVSEGPDGLLYFHVFVSVGALTAYIVQFYLAWRMRQGRKASRQTHVRVGCSFCALRLTSYVTSFAV